jgi:hypothetical protein
MCKVQYFKKTLQEEILEKKFDEIYRFAWTRNCSPFLGLTTHLHSAASHAGF